MGTVDSYDRIIICDYCGAICTYSFWIRHVIDDTFEELCDECNLIFCEGEEE